MLTDDVLFYYISSLPLEQPVWLKPQVLGTSVNELFGSLVTEAASSFPLAGFDPIGLFSLEQPVMAQALCN
jgi:hypothetical protein